MMMKTVSVFGLLLCWSVTDALTERFMGIPTPVTLTLTGTTPPGESTDSRSFPEQMDYVLQLEGWDAQHVHLVRQRFMGLPNVIVAGREDTSAEPSGNIAFYIDVKNGGSFSCELAREGQCIMAAMFDNGADICYISFGSRVADCFPRTMHDDLTENDDAVLDIDDDGGADDSTSAGRIVVDLAVTVDSSVMAIFDARHQGDSSAVRRELQIYTALLANKMNVELSAVREVTYGEMEILVYPVALLCPETESKMNVPRRGKLEQQMSLITDTLASKPADVQGTNYFVQVIALTRNKPTDIPTGPEAEGQLCEQRGVVSSPVKFRDASPDAARAVKIALGVDDNTIALDVEDTLNTLSGCRVVSGYTDEQFRDLYCEGELQVGDSSLDIQCQHQTGWAGSTACDDSSASVCSQHRVIRCRTPSGACNSSLPLVWNGTPCGPNKVCYDQKCLPTQSVCKDDLTLPKYGTEPQPMCTEDSPCARSARDVNDIVAALAKRAKSSCACCCFSTKVRSRRNRCCRLGRKKTKEDCYCCGKLKNTREPSNFAGDVY